MRNHGKTYAIIVNGEERRRRFMADYEAACAYALEIYHGDLNREIEVVEVDDRTGRQSVCPVILLPPGCEPGDLGYDPRY